MKANNVKTKLKSLLKKVDSDKSGFVQYDVFFPMLELHKVDLTSKAIAWLKKNHSKNQTINYKDAINALTIDLMAAGQEESEMKWTVFALQAAKSKIGDDSISQVGEISHVKAQNNEPMVKTGASFLSKDKLQKMERDYQQSKKDEKSIAALSKVESKVASQKPAESKVAPSIAPSKAKTEVTQLSKIDEVDENPTVLGEISKF